MITVRIQRNGITVSGHAPTVPGVPPGNNIICAAVSALNLALIDGLANVIGIDLDAQIDAGYMRIRWAQPLQAAAAAIVETWQRGIGNIADAYGGVIILGHGGPKMPEKDAKAGKNHE